MPWIFSNPPKAVQWVGAISYALALTALTGLQFGGDDLLSYYLPFAAGCLDCGFVPYFARWFLWPLTLIPPEYLWTVWTALSLALFLSVSYSMDHNPLLPLLTFTLFGQIALGQIDALVAVGLGLAWRGPGYWRGLGLLMAMIKPQISLPFALLLLWHAEWPARRHLLSVPLIAMLISFAQFGPLWVHDWLSHSQPSVHMWRAAPVMLMPFGLLALLAPLGLSNRPQQLRVALISAAFIPQHSIYSHIVWLLFLPMRWWYVPLSWIWILFYPWLDYEAPIMQFIFPLAVLLTERFAPHPEE